MYRIKKTVNNTETINLVFDDIIDAEKIFSDLQYDEYIRFKKLYASGINKETVVNKVDSDIVYRKYRISVPTFYVEIVLEYIRN